MVHEMKTNKYEMINFNKYFWLAFSAFTLIAFLSVKIAFMVIGMYFLFIALFLKYQYYMLKDWTEVEGTVLEKKIVENGIAARGYTLYIVQIKYVYILNQKKIYSTVISLFENDFYTADNKTLEHRVRKIKRGQSETAYINPNKTRSLLFIEMFSEAMFYFYFNLLLGLTLIISGLMMEF